MKKNNSELKLFALMGAIVALGGGFLLVSSKFNDDKPPEPVATPKPMDANDFEQRLWSNVRWKKGKATAPYAIVEFGDFECPSCRRAYNQVLKLFGHSVDVEFGFVGYPLPQHSMAMPAASAAEAAGLQNKFWEMYDLIFEGEKTELTDALLIKYAEKIGLDKAKFETDRKGAVVKALIEKDKQLVESSSINETPTFAILDRRTKKMSFVVGGQKLMAEIEGLPGLPTPPPPKSDD
jgi:protein-disulfide isomerase